MYCNVWCDNLCGINLCDWQLTCINKSHAYISTVLQAISLGMLLLCYHTVDGHMDDLLENSATPLDPALPKQWKSMHAPDSCIGYGWERERERRVFNLTTMLSSLRTPYQPLLLWDAVPSAVACGQIAAPSPTGYPLWPPAPGSHQQYAQPWPPDGSLAWWWHHSLYHSHQARERKQYFIILWCEYIHDH